jgi:hypothetical protein
MDKTRNDSAQTTHGTGSQSGTGGLHAQTGLLASLCNTWRAILAFFSHSPAPARETTPTPEECHFLDEQEATAFARKCISQGYWAEVQQNVYDYSWSVEYAPLKPK